MAVELPEPLQWVLLLLAGTRWPEADEDQLRQMADHWRKAAQSLEDAAHGADAAIKRALEGQQGSAAEALTKHWAQYTTGKGTKDDPGFFPGLVDGCNGMGDMLEAMANSAETAKIQIIAQLGILAFDIATAEAEAPVTFGASMAQIPIVVGITREAVGQILKKLLAEALEHAVKQAVQMAAINLMAQTIEVMQGHRKSIDGKELGQNALGGAVAGATGHVLGKGVGAAGEKLGLGKAMDSLPGKMVTGAAVGVGTDVTTQAITTGHVDSNSLLGSGLSGAGGVAAHAGAAAAREHFNGPNVPTPHEGQLPTFSGTPHADSPSNTYRGPGSSDHSAPSSAPADRPSLTPFTPHDPSTAGPGRGASEPSAAPHLDTTAPSHTEAPSSRPADSQPAPAPSHSAAPSFTPRPAESEPHLSAPAGEHPAAPRDFTTQPPATAEPHMAPEHTAAPTFTPRPAESEPHLSAPAGEHPAAPRDFTTQPPATAEPHMAPEHTAPPVEQPVASRPLDLTTSHPAEAEPHVAPDHTATPVEQPVAAHSGQPEPKLATPGPDHTATPVEQPAASRPQQYEPQLATPAPDHTATPVEQPVAAHSGQPEPKLATPGPDHMATPVEQPAASRPQQYEPQLATPAPDHTATPVEQPMAAHSGQPEPKLATPAPDHTATPLEQPTASRPQQYEPQLATPAPEHTAPAPAPAPEHTAPAPAAEPHSTGVPSGLGGSMPSFRPEPASAGTGGSPSRHESTAPSERPAAPPEIHLDDAGITADPMAHTPTAQPEATPTATPTADPAGQAGQGGIPMAPPPAFAAPGGGGGHSSGGARPAPPTTSTPHSGGTPSAPRATEPTTGGTGLGKSVSRPGRSEGIFDKQRADRQAELDKLRADGGGHKVSDTAQALGRDQRQTSRPPQDEFFDRQRAERQAELDKLRADGGGHKVSDTAQDLGRDQRQTATPPHDEIFERRRAEREAELEQLRRQGNDLINDEIRAVGKQGGTLSHMSESDRLQAIDGMSLADRRKLATSSMAVDQLRANLTPKEFARTAAHLMVHVPQEVHAPISARNEAHAQVERMLQDPDVAAKLLKSGANVGVAPKDKPQTTLPGLDKYAGQTTHTSAGGGRNYDDIRGSGGKNTSFTEENLTGDHTTIGGSKHYAEGYSTTTHEFAHTIHDFGLSAADKKLIKDTYDKKFNDPAAEWVDGKHQDNYSRSDDHEYFAQVTNAWLGTNHGKDAKAGEHDPGRNNGPDWVRQHEPDLVPLLERLYGADPNAIHSEPANQVRANTGQYEDFREFWAGVDERMPETPAPAGHAAPTHQPASEPHSPVEDPFSDAHAIDDPFSDAHAIEDPHPAPHQDAHIPPAPPMPHEGPGAAHDLPRPAPTQTNDTEAHPGGQQGHGDHADQPPREPKLLRWAPATDPKGKGRWEEAPEGSSTTMTWDEWKSLPGKRKTEAVIDVNRIKGDLPEIANELMKTNHPDLADGVLHRVALPEARDIKAKGDELRTALRDLFDNPTAAGHDRVVGLADQLGADLKGQVKGAAEFGGLYTLRNEYGPLVGTAKTLIDPEMTPEKLKTEEGAPGYRTPIGSDPEKVKALVDFVQRYRRDHAYGDVLEGDQWKTVGGSLDDHIARLKGDEADHTGADTPEAIAARRQAMQERAKFVGELSKQNIERLTHETDPLMNSDPKMRELYNELNDLPYRLKHSTPAYHAIANSGVLSSQGDLGRRSANYLASGKSSEKNTSNLGNDDFAFFRMETGDAPMATRYGPTTMVFDAGLLKHYDGWVSLHDQLEPLDRPAMQEFRLKGGEGVDDTVLRTTKYAPGVAGPGTKSRWENTYPGQSDSGRKRVDVTFDQEVFKGEDVVEGLSRSVLREVDRGGEPLKQHALELGKAVTDAKQRLAEATDGAGQEAARQDLAKAQADLGKLVSSLYRPEAKFGSGLPIDPRLEGGNHPIEDRPADQPPFRPITVHNPIGDGRYREDGTLDPLAFTAAQKADAVADREREGLKALGEGNSVKGVDDALRQFKPAQESAQISVDRTKEFLEQARASNDPDRVKLAEKLLEDRESALKRVKQHQEDAEATRQRLVEERAREQEAAREQEEADRVKKEEARAKSEQTRAEADQRRAATIASKGAQQTPTARATKEVTKVATWYERQITAERRKPTPDEARIAQLEAGQEAAQATQQLLTDELGGDAASAIEREYADKFKDLVASLKRK